MRPPDRVNTMIAKKKKSRKARQVGPTAQQLLDFFNAKVEAVRQSSASLTSVLKTKFAEQFAPLSQRRVI